MVISTGNWNSLELNFQKSWSPECKAENFFQGNDQVFFLQLNLGSCLDVKRKRDLFFYSSAKLLRICFWKCWFVFFCFSSYDMFVLNVADWVSLVYFPFQLICSYGGLPGKTDRIRAWNSCAFLKLIFNAWETFYPWFVYAWAYSNARLYLFIYSLLFNLCVYIPNTSIFKTYLGIRNTITVFLSASLDSYLQKSEGAR